MEKFWKSFGKMWKSFTRWAWDIARNLWEDYLKDELMDQIKHLAKTAIEAADVYTDSPKFEENKKVVIDFIFDHITLPKWLVIFKGMIRNILSKSIDKEVDKLLKKANGLIG